MAETASAVRLDRVTKSFGTRRVLDDVSFEVAPGRGFVILGRSGTGKSVTLRHIIGLLHPDRGRVFVGADEISALDGPELGIELASALHKLYPNDYKIEKLPELLMNESTFNAILAGQDPRRIAEDWQERLEKFLAVREKYLLYK